MTDPINLRLFIELELPATVVTALGRIQKACRSKLPDGTVRWVPPDGIHLTLRFLGEVEAARRPAAETALRKAAKQAPGERRLQLDGYGTFPGGKEAPRVLFVGLSDLSDNIPALSQALDQALDAAGWPTERRRLRPHLTLGRVREGLRPTQIDALRRAIGALPALEPLAFAGKCLALVRSELSTGGSRYTRLAAAEL